MPRLKKYLYRKLGYDQLGNNRDRKKPSPEDETIWFQFDVTPLDAGHKLIQ